MDYFTFLQIRKEEDTKQQFTYYLIETKGYTAEEAEKEANIYYPKMDYKKVKRYIDNMEQLAADARRAANDESIEQLEIKVQSIIYWAHKTKNEIEREKKKQQEDKQQCFIS